MRFRLAAILPIYLLIFIASYGGAYLLRFEFDLPEPYLDQLRRSLPLVLGLKLVTCLAVGEWRRSFRYVTLADIASIATASTVASSLVYAANLTIYVSFPIPRSVILIDWMFTVLAFGLVRSSYRIYSESIRPAFTHGQLDRTVIFGSTGSGLGILRAIQSSNPTYRVVAFVEEGDRNEHALIAGLRVFSLAKLGWQKLAAKTRAHHVLIPGSLSGKRAREIIEQTAAVGLKAHMIPDVGELVDGRYRLAIREPTISDLLGRESTNLDMQSITDCVTGRRVLVTGAAGSIGSELCRQIHLLAPESLVLVDQSEKGMFEIEQEFSALPSVTTPLDYVIADVTNEEALQKVFEVHRPQLVFHAAAYKHVPLMERNPQVAVRNNVLGTRTTVDLADRFDVERFVLISTDKAVRPTSIMGATKLLAEKCVQAAAANSNTKFITVRFGNVLNSSGSVVPTFSRQIAAGGPITVTHKQMERFFMTIPEAVQLVLQAGAIAETGDVLILEMGKPVKIVDLARDMILLSGLRYPDDIDIVFTGLRPGEKLREELFYETERGNRKIHDKIFRGTRQAIEPTIIRREVDRLLEASGGSADETRSVLNEIVAGYISDDERSTTRLKPAA
jgi:FlaA1/EpsC-like NDP-sugar epimerase